MTVVAIVGRPNVGKSTLFNRLVGGRQALVDDRPGVTRDRNYGEGSFLGRRYHFIDTGGFEPVPEDQLFVEVRKQAEMAIDEADILLFVVDRQTGITTADQLTANILRKRIPKEKMSKVLLLVNKCDGPMQDYESAEFWELGLSEPMSISAEHGRGIYELWEFLHANSEEGEDWDEEEEDGELRIAILGRPNVGKSTLVNRLIGEEKHVVHNSPGTTMDAIDSVIEVEGQRYVIVDTAGIRRRARIGDKLESFAVSRSIKAIERCHITLLMIDSSLGVSHQDARLASLISDRGRACIILMNRWDELKDNPERNVHVINDELERSLPHLSWVPILYISALTGKGCHRIFPEIHKVFKQFDTRISTAKINRFLEEAVGNNPPPQKHHHRVRLNFITQARVRPPTFVIWGNSPDAIPDSYRRYLENTMRKTFGFKGTPLKIHLRKKRKQWEDLQR